MTLQLMGLHEIAELIGVSRQRADQLGREAGFPKTVQAQAKQPELKAGRVWKRAEVERWHRARKAKR